MRIKTGNRQSLMLFRKQKRKRNENEIQIKVLTQSLRWNNRLIRARKLESVRPEANVRRNS